MAGTVSVIGSIAAASGGGTTAWLGTGAALLALITAPTPRRASLLLGLSSVGLVTTAAFDGTLMLALTGSLALGGVTTEMLLGHWYLIDPRLPRWPLRRLALVGGLALVGDAILLAIGGWGSDQRSAVTVFMVMAVITTVLLVGVWFSLKEPAYTAVMAATGLSYLALLTALASTTIGRSLISEGETILEVPRLVVL